VVVLTRLEDREEALKDDFQLESGNYGYDDDEGDEWEEAQADWDGAGEEVEEGEKDTTAKDESAAYLDFLNEEAQKFSNLEGDYESEDELGEDSVLLESPLDQIEPYQTFRQALTSESLKDVRFSFLEEDTDR
jgi:importin-7